ncbi:phosphotransferase [Mycobacterium sp. pUA109]|uniref:phosphotransferase n=1 Tax=Mycobacterium sp. pUA109 TaxID=3238982 RepID=UPI00351B6372
MTHIVDTVGDLTPEWFTGALCEGGTIGEEVSVTSAKTELVGTGQLGLVVRADLEYDAEGGPASLIVKLPSQDASSRHLGAAMGVYEAEVRFYQEIEPLVTVQVPRMHWGGLEPQTGRFTLVIDNLSPGSVVGDMVVGCSLEHARLAVMELVKLQSSSWDHPELLGRKWIADAARTEMLFAAVPAALGPFLERFADRLEPEHIDLVKQLAPKASLYTTKAWKRPFVVAHGDYRLDNVMFGVDPAAPPISIIDWQAARLAPPLVDVAIFLGACVSPAERRAHERDLLRRYHEGLRSAGVEGFSLDDCWEGYRRAALYPFLLGVAMSMTLERTERGDAMWARLMRDTADLVHATGAADVLD